MLSSIYTTGKKYTLFLLMAASRAAIPRGYYSAPFFTNLRICIVLGRCVFLIFVHTFFSGFDLSKRDKQVKPSGHKVSLENQNGLLLVPQVLRVVQLLGWP